MVTILSPTLRASWNSSNLLLPALHRQQDQEVENPQDDGERQKLVQPGALPGAGHREDERCGHEIQHSVLRSAGEGLMELLAELFKRAEHDSLPNPPHGVKVKVEVVDELQGRRRHLASYI